jgi:two-component system CheB/CheR fusion protein
MSVAATRAAAVQANGTQAMGGRGDASWSGALLPIVGIGASAGGLEAFQEFLANAAADSGMGYVLLPHLDPTHESLLPQLLQRHTKMPVKHAVDGIAIERDQVYVLPPNVSCIVSAGKLVLAPFEEPRGFRRPIDMFFKALAADRGQSAACIVLSGTGSDGSAGLRAVKEAGGLTLVQSPETAKYDGMPLSAAATGLVDHILPTADMPAALANYFGAAEDAMSLEEQEAAAAYVLSVCETMRLRVGHDFSQYKRNTLLRRIARRMQVLGVTTHDQYLEKLKEAGQECELLLRDLLINVTEFFRDKKAFRALREEVIADLVSRASAADTLRIWVPGCSSGEEAYSIAILVAEEMKRAAVRPRVQVFATDIDAQMLEFARRGVYPDSISRDVPEEFLAEYFIPGEASFAIAGKIRDMVHFSNHSLIKDPPFSKMDLISCRNVLIYMRQELQERIIPLLHFALKPDGYLFLGPAEGITHRSDLLTTINLPARIYRRRPESSTKPIDLPISFRRNDSARPKVELYEPLDGDANTARLAVQRMFDRYVQPHVMVDRRGEIKFTSGRTSKYLELAAGMPSNKLLDLARSDLKPYLRSTIERARSTGARQVVRDLEIRSEQGTQSIDLIADPIDENSVLVVFQDVDAFRAGTEDGVLASKTGGSGSDGERIRILEDELDHTRDQLRTTIEELETSNEELKSSNEEMMSMNEELQSTNEELTTVNDELKVKLDELASANNDLQNFLQSTQIATVFVDKTMSIRNFTPAARDLFGLREQDRKRPLDEVVANFDASGLKDDMRRVLETLAPVERDIVTTDGARQFLLRILPYRTMTDTIEGIVLTFNEITKVNQLRSELLVSHSRYEAAVKASGHLLFDWEPESGKALFAGAIEAITGYIEAELEGGIDRFLEIVHPDDRNSIRKFVRSAPSTGEFVETSFRIVRKGGEIRACEARGTFLEVGRGRPPRLIGFIRDIETRVQLEASQRRLMHELQHRVKNTLSTVQSLVRRSAQTKVDKAEFEQAITARISALSRTHNLLSESRWQSASLRQIVRDEINPYLEDGQSDTVVDGPDVLLTPRQALAFCLAVHELATNAAKYGAMSHAGGRVEARWKNVGSNGTETLLFEWIETGGPKVKAKPGRGFGRTLLERAVASDLDGEISLEFREGGVHCRILARLDADRQEISETGGSPTCWFDDASSDRLG